MINRVFVGVYDKWGIIPIVPLRGQNYFQWIINIDGRDNKDSKKCLIPLCDFYSKHQLYS